MSIWAMLPRQITLVPGPARVTRVFICFGVRVLGLVDNQVFLDEGAAAHEVQRLDLDPRADQVAGRRPAPFAAVGPPSSSLAWLEDVEVVLEGAHPGAIFSSSVPGRKPMSSPTGTVTRVMMISL